MDPSLKQRLDVLVSAEPTAGLIVHELAALCAARPESACDLLSLVDQYYRRGKLSPDIFRRVRPGIVRHILGIPESALPVRVGSRESRSTEGDGPAPAVTSATPAAPGPDLPSASWISSRRGPPPPGARAVATAISVVSLSRPESQSSRTSQAIVSAALLVVLAAALGARDWQLREGRSEWDSSATPAPAVSAPALAAAAKPTAPEVPLRAAIATPHPVAGRSSTAITSEGSGDAPARVVAQGPVVTGQGLSLAADRYVASPAQRRIDVSVRRTGEAGTPVAFVWWTHGGGARAGTDYVAIRPRQVTIPAAADAVQLSIALRRDPARKHTELFYVSIARAPGAAAPWSQDSIRQATVFLLAGD